VGEKMIGKGDVVKVGENFGVVVREIGAVRERIEQLGSLE
jgi:predicted RecA/RadA family phage recombinase